MTLLELYKSFNENKVFYDYYCSTGSQAGGKVFSFINTNYRGILTFKGQELQGFAKGFRVIESVEGQDRSGWKKSEGAGQELQKQHVVNMRKSELFRVVDNTYVKTSRGIVFKKMMDDQNLKPIEKRLLCYLLILAGYFSDTPNYIIEQSKEFFELCNESGYSEEDILTMQKNLIQSNIANAETLLLTDYLYLDCFFKKLDDIDFLSNFQTASTKEKNELKQYVLSNYTNKRYACLISKKFKPGGAYTKNTVLDNAWMLYVSKKVIDDTQKSFDSFINTVVDAYSELFDTVDKSNLKKFIYDTDKNRSVFQVIFSKVKGIPISPLDVEKDLTDIEIKQLSQSDTTDEVGAKNVEVASSALKKLAKLNAGYKCVLEDCEMCKYFTAKESNKPYLEIHHFIPREFANDFDVSVEILENYIALCPNCHRKIHLAVDGERKHMINTLYNKKKDSLEQNGLHFDLKQIYRYYKIENE